MSVVSASAHSITIRVATDEDVEFLAGAMLHANIERYRHKPDWDAEAFFERARAVTAAQVRGEIADSTTYVIESTDERAGRLRVVRAGEQLEIAGIQLLPAFRQRGIGTFVIRSLLHEGESRGIPVVLEVEHDNPQARSLYLRLGFEPLDEKAGHTLMIARHRR